MATYYIDPTGVDSAGRTGSNVAGQQWATLNYALNTRMVSGDTVHVNTGTYTLSSQVSVPTGMSIEGDGDGSLFNCTVGGTSYTLSLSSGSEGTNGNQHISSIKMSGGSGLNSYTAYAPIVVNLRKNVEISNCTFQYFSHNGPAFKGSGQAGGAQPVVFATGNSFHDNDVLDCCTFVGIGTPGGAGFGGLQIGGQLGMLVYNNSITVSYRTGGLNGYCIKYDGDGYNRGLKIYGNTFVRPPFSGMTDDFDFAIELWNSQGGIEIYDNNTGGGFDMSGDDPSPVNDVGGYGFAAKIHDNTWDWGSYQANNQHGVYLERAQTGGMYIYNNSFNYISTPIITYQGYDTRAHDVFEDVYVFSNIANNVGCTNNHYCNFMSLSNIGVDSNGIIYQRIHILNNTAVQGSGGAGTEAFFQTHIAGTGTLFYIQNNIIVGFGAAGSVGTLIVDRSELVSLTHITYQNNILYQNLNNDWGYYYSGPNPTFDSCTNNRKNVNPSLVSTTDFHLQAGSQAIGNGTHITDPSLYTTDYDGNVLGNPPEIGAYEYGSSPGSAPTVTTSSVTRIATVSASCGGNVTSDGSSAVTARGVCWNTSTNPTISNSKTVNGSGTGVFVSSITGLSSSTNYFVRAYATNIIDTSYGANVQFATLSSSSAIYPPTVTTTSVTSINANSALSGGNVTSDGSSFVSAKGVCWSTNINPSIGLATKTNDGNGTGSYASTLSNLNPSTNYYVRAYATNAADTSYGANIQFATLQATPSSYLNKTGLMFLYNGKFLIR